jgi:hypothetical protein
MKHIIVDIKTKIILAKTEDPAVATAVKNALLDVEVLAIFKAGIHKNSYDTIIDSNIKNMWIRYENRIITVLDNFEVNDSIIQKKQLAFTKKSLIEQLYTIITTPISHCSYFINPYIPYLFESMLAGNEEKYLTEYLEYRKLPRHEAIKDIEVKLNSYKGLMIKLQSVVDYYIEQMILENDCEKLEMIADEFSGKLRIWN